MLQALRESEERYRALVELSPDGILVHFGGTIVFANTKAAELLGASSPDDLHGKKVLDFVHPDYREMVVDRIRRLAEEGPTVPLLEEVLVRLDGTTFDAEVVAAAYQLEGGPAVQVVFRDITERKATMDQVRRQRDELGALHHTALGLVRNLDPKQLLQTIVARAAALAGTEHGYLYVRDQEAGDLVVSVGVGDFVGWIGHHLKRGEGIAGTVWATGKPVLVEDYDEWEHRAASFPRGVLHAGLGVPLTSGVELVGVIGLAHVERGQVFGDEAVSLLSRFAQLASLALHNAELYENVRAGLERERELTHQLRAADEMKNTFLAAVSHELRTPLSAVMGVAQTLERELDRLPPEEVRELLHGLSTKASTLNRLLSDLLDLDRLSRGILEPQRRSVEVGELIRRVVDQMEVVDRPVRVEATPVTVPVDAAKIERVVENLVSNAIRHTAPGGAIWVGCRPTEDGGALLWVDDEGPGVPDEIAEAIFEPFRQGPSQHAHSPGVGVGLSLVARFAELHGGRAWVEPRMSGGSSFKVYLPGSEADG
jgi:PAS domain S-box-containing protein